MQVTYALSAILFHCTLNGAWDSWGDRLLHLFIDPAQQSITGHFGAPVKQPKSLKERKSFLRKYWGD